MYCTECGALVDAATRFCPACRRPLPTQRASRLRAIVGPEVDLAALGKLRAEKERLEAELQALLDRAHGGTLTGADRARWGEVRGRWVAVRDDLTRRMQYMEARRAHERRERERRSGERRRQQTALEFPDRRTGTDRRAADDRRSGSDRRHPFPPEPPSPPS